MKIGIDVDDVLRLFTIRVINFAKIKYPKAFKGYQGDIDIKYHFNGNKITWHFKDIDLSYEDIEKIWTEYFVEELYITAPPCLKAYVGWKMLKHFAEIEGHKLICVSNQTGIRISYTLEWLGKHGFDFTELYFISNKHELDIDILFDDSVINHYRWKKSGRDPNKFIMVANFYNRKTKCNHKINDLTEAVDEIKKINA